MSKDVRTAYNVKGRVFVRGSCPFAWVGKGVSEATFGAFVRIRL